MDKIKAYLSLAAEAAWGFIQTKRGKIAIAVLVVIAVAAVALHRGVKPAPKIEERAAPVSCPAASEPMVIIKPDTESLEAAESAKQRADELTDRLNESEAAKDRLQQKVRDYEKQLAKRPKARALVLSPADARSLSNIR